MKYCANCQVKVRGSGSHCPLCQSPLSDLGGDSSETFPYVPTTYHQYHLFFRALIFLSIVIGVIAIALNLLIPGRYTGWSIFVLAGIGCLWLILTIAVHKRRNIMKNLLYQSLLLCLLAIGWDYLTGWHNWSLDFAVPIILLVSLLGVILVGKLLSYPLVSQMIYVLLAIALAALLPLILWLLGKLHVLWPTIITIAASIITLAALLIFLDRPFKRELKRRLHI